MIKTTCSNDASQLGGKLAVYAVHEPSKDTITPPIVNGSGRRSHLGLSHAVFAGFIIPVDYLQLYEDDPVLTLKEIEGGRLDMDADHFPAVLWSGNPPGADYDPDNMQDGLFQGYLLVMSHIFLGPLTAMGHVSHATCSCNAVLHDMTTVEPEHLAYGCVQAHFIISSMNQWNEDDSTFNYRIFYYNVVSLICDCKDKVWVADLLKWWNVQLFKNENGCQVDRDSDDEANSDSVGVSNSSSTAQRSNTSTLAKMQAQMRARMVGTQAPAPISSASARLAAQNESSPSPPLQLAAAPHSRPVPAPISSTRPPAQSESPPSLPPRLSTAPCSRPAAPAPRPPPPPPPPSQQPPSALTPPRSSTIVRPRIPSRSISPLTEQDNNNNNNNEPTKKKKSKSKSKSKTESSKSKGKRRHIEYTDDENQNNEVQGTSSRRSKRTHT
ncbi:hypothetical protein BDN67DRAFT_1072638 [Paxillus ammoniavirescens]|nr:hypothetical protein BDN67DRAFT_1072638 [Paxillus ammoniavirescens]